MVSFGVERYGGLPDGGAHGMLDRGCMLMMGVAE